MEYITSSIWITSIILSFVISLITIKLSLLIIAKTKTMDTPNERSNHITPIPKGAGIGIILSLLILYYIFFPINDFIFTFSVSLLCVISFINDNKNISILIRLITHIILALFVIYLWPPLLDLHLLNNIMPNWIFITLIILFIIWMTNLYNFMDGIDGISGIQCIIIGTGIGTCLFYSNDINKIENILSGFLIGSGGAFLIWNWQPAKVFLGDAGSIPLGFINAILVLLLFKNGLWYVAFILNSYYLSDASITLLNRILKKEIPWQAHKNHFYQKAVNNGYSHSKVCIFIIIHGVFLIILSLFTTLYPNNINILFSILISSLSTIYLLYYLNKIPKNVKKE